MLTLALGWPRERVPERSRTLVAKGDAVWVWPGIPLTLRRGTEVIPVAAEKIRAWLTRLHGPEALDKDLLRAVASAARCLAAGDPIAAQKALDALGLTELSHDGEALMRAVADHLGVKTLDLPLRASTRTWSAQDIALHLPIFKQHAEAARVLAKEIIPFDPQNHPGFDPQKHPRWPAGAPDSQGGEFAPADASGVSIIPVVSRPRRPKRQPPADDGWNGRPSDPTPGIGDNSDKFNDAPELPKEEPQPEERYEMVKGIGQELDEALAAGAVLWIQNYLQGLVTIGWLMSAPTYYYYQLKANLDPPETLEELQDAVATPTWGYQIHHIVELESGPGEGVSDDLLTSRANEVRIPEMKHKEISDWYQTQNKDYGGLSPRDYLRGKSWDERYRLGIQKLIDFGVLEP